MASPEPTCTHGQRKGGPCGTCLHAKPCACGGTAEDPVAAGLAPQLEALRKTSVAQRYTAEQLKSSLRGLVMPDYGSAGVQAGAHVLHIFLMLILMDGSGSAAACAGQLIMLGYCPRVLNTLLSPAARCTQRQRLVSSRRHCGCICSTWCCRAGASRRSSACRPRRARSVTRRRACRPPPAMLPRTVQLHRAPRLVGPGRKHKMLRAPGRAAAPALPEGRVRRGRTGTAAGDLGRANAQQAHPSADWPGALLSALLLHVCAPVSQRRHRGTRHRHGDGRVLVGLPGRQDRRLLPSQVLVRVRT